MSAGSILVPLDGSPQSEAVLPLATAIAKSAGTGVDACKRG